MSLPIEPIIPKCAESLLTPCLLVDNHRVKRNLGDMARRLSKWNCFFRPHLKTVKSAPFAAIMTAGHSRNISVSTITELRYFAKYGYTDILYPVGIAGVKIQPILDIMQDHPALSVGIILDSVVAVEQVVQAMKQAESSWKARRPATTISSSSSKEEGKEASPPEQVWVPKRLQVLIEVDVGQNRGGLEPESDQLIEVAKAILAVEELLEFRGVLTHAGHSYASKGAEELPRYCSDEHCRIRTAASRLESNGIACPVISIGSTPTCSKHTADTTRGVTEVRAGVYPLMDLDQAGIGSCKVDDIAMTVLTTVIGHNHATRRLVVDAGALALSKDLSASQHAAMQPTGYGWIYGYPDLYVSSVSQEHGMVATRDPGFPLDFAKHPIGSKLRILPNHACLTAAGHTHYWMYDLFNEDHPAERWDRINGFE
jgi:D-serine deaminase-like pyridoxal phosphate-dependent protein